MRTLRNFLAVLIVAIPGSALAQPAESIEKVEQRTAARFWTEPHPATGRRQIVRFGSTLGAPAVIRYRFIESETEGRREACGGATQTLAAGLKNSRLSPEVFKEEVLRGMQWWSAVTQIDLIPASSIAETNLVIGFSWFGFSAEGGDVAAAYLLFFAPRVDGVRPIRKGRICFDSSLVWVAAGKGDGQNELMEAEVVAAHETGHILGLNHVRSRDQVMAQGSTVKRLGKSDVSGVQYIYGKRPNIGGP